MPPTSASSSASAPPARAPPALAGGLTFRPIPPPAQPPPPPPPAPTTADDAGDDSSVLGGDDDDDSISVSTDDSQPQQQLQWRRGNGDKTGFRDTGETAAVPDTSFLLRDKIRLFDRWAPEAARLAAQIHFDDADGHGGDQRRRPPRRANGPNLNFGLVSGAAKPLLPPIGQTDLHRRQVAAQARARERLDAKSAATTVVFSPQDLRPTEDGALAVLREKIIPSIPQLTVQHIRLLERGFESMLRRALVDHTHNMTILFAEKMRRQVGAHLYDATARQRRERQAQQQLGAECQVTRHKLSRTQTQLQQIDARARALEEKYRDAQRREHQWAKERGLVIEYYKKKCQMLNLVNDRLKRDVQTQLQAEANRLKYKHVVHHQYQPGGGGGERSGGVDADGKDGGQNKSENGQPSQRVMELLLSDVERLEKALSEEFRFDPSLPWGDGVALALGVRPQPSAGEADGSAGDAGGDSGNDGSGSRPLLSERILMDAEAGGGHFMPTKTYDFSLSRAEQRQGPSLANVPGQLILSPFRHNRVKRSRKQRRDAEVGAGEDELVESGATGDGPRRPKPRRRARGHSRAHETLSSSASSSSPATSDDDSGFDTAKPLAEVVVPMSSAAASAAVGGGDDGVEHVSEEKPEDPAVEPSAEPASSSTEHERNLEREAAKRARREAKAQRRERKRAEKRRLQEQRRLDRDRKRNLKNAAREQAEAEREQQKVKARAERDRAIEDGTASSAPVTAAPDGDDDVAEGDTGDVAPARVGADERAGVDVDQVDDDSESSTFADAPPDPLSVPWRTATSHALAWEAHMALLCEKNRTLLTDNQKAIVLLSRRIHGLQQDIETKSQSMEAEELEVKTLEDLQAQLESPELNEQLQREFNTNVERIGAYELRIQRKRKDYDDHVQKLEDEWSEQNRGFDEERETAKNDLDAAQAHVKQSNATLDKVVEQSLQKLHSKAAKPLSDVDAKITALDDRKAQAELECENIVQACAVVNDKMIHSVIAWQSSEEAVNSASAGIMQSALIAKRQKELAARLGIEKQRADRAHKRLAQTLEEIEQDRVSLAKQREAALKVMEASMMSSRSEAEKSVAKRRVQLHDRLEELKAEYEERLFKLEHLRERKAQGHAERKEQVKEVYTAELLALNESRQAIERENEEIQEKINENLRKRREMFEAELKLLANIKRKKQLEDDAKKLSQNLKDLTLARQGENTAHRRQTQKLEADFDNKCKDLKAQLAEIMQIETDPNRQQYVVEQKQRSEAKLKALKRTRDEGKEQAQHLTKITLLALEGIHAAFKDVMQTLRDEETALQSQLDVLEMYNDVNGDGDGGDTPKSAAVSDAEGKRQYRLKQAELVHLRRRIATEEGEYADNVAVHEDEVERLRAELETGESTYQNAVDEEKASYRAILIANSKLSQQEMDERVAQESSLRSELQLAHSRYTETLREREDQRKQRMTVLFDQEIGLKKRIDDMQAEIVALSLSNESTMSARLEELKRRNQDSQIAIQDKTEEVAKLSDQIAVMMAQNNMIRQSVVLTNKVLADTKVRQQRYRQFCRDEELLWSQRRADLAEEAQRREAMRQEVLKHQEVLQQNAIASDAMLRDASDHAKQYEETIASLRAQLQAEAEKREEAEQRAINAEFEAERRVHRKSDALAAGPMPVPPKHDRGKTTGARRTRKAKPAVSEADDADRAVDSADADAPADVAPVKVIEPRPKLALEDDDQVDELGATSTGHGGESGRSRHERFQRSMAHLEDARGAHDGIEGDTAVGNADNAAMDASSDGGAAAIANAADALAAISAVVDGEGDGLSDKADSVDGLHDLEAEVQELDALAEQLRAPIALPARAASADAPSSRDQPLVAPAYEGDGNDVFAMEVELGRVHMDSDRVKQNLGAAYDDDVHTPVAVIDRASRVLEGLEDALFGPGDERARTMASLNIVQRARYDAILEALIVLSEYLPPRQVLLEQRPVLCRSCRSTMSHDADVEGDFVGDSHVPLGALADAGDGTSESGAATSTEARASVGDADDTDAAALTAAGDADRRDAAAAGDAERREPAVAGDATASADLAGVIKSAGLDQDTTQNADGVGPVATEAASRSRQSAESDGQPKPVKAATKQRAAKPKARGSAAKSELVQAFATTGDRKEALKILQDAEQHQGIVWRELKEERDRVEQERQKLRLEKVAYRRQQVQDQLEKKKRDAVERQEKEDEERANKRRTKERASELAAVAAAPSIGAPPGSAAVASAAPPSSGVGSSSSETVALEREVLRLQGDIKKERASALQAEKEHLRILRDMERDCADKVRRASRSAAQMDGALKSAKTAITDLQSQVQRQTRNAALIKKLETELKMHKAQSESAETARAAMHGQLTTERQTLARQVEQLRRRLIIRAVWFRSQLVNLQRLINLAIQMDEYLTPELTCSYCLNLYKQPQTLYPCGHTLCAACIDTIQCNPENLERRVICIECKKECFETAPNHSVEGLLSRYGWFSVCLVESRAALQQVAVGDLHMQYNTTIKKGQRFIANVGVDFAAQSSAVVDHEESSKPAKRAQRSKTKR